MSRYNRKLNVDLIRKFINETKGNRLSLNNVPLCKLTIDGELVWDKHPEVVWTIDEEATSTTPGKKHSNCYYCKAEVGTADIPATEYFRYRQLDDGTLAISAWDKSNLPKVLVIPNRYDGKRITRIDDEAFSGTNIEIVIVPRGITIGYSAFKDCKYLKAIANADGSPQLSGTIEGSAFIGCELWGVMIDYGAKVSLNSFPYTTNVFFMDEEPDDYSGDSRFYFYSEEEKSGNYWRWVSSRYTNFPMVWGTDVDDADYSDYHGTVSPTCTTYGYTRDNYYIQKVNYGIILVSIGDKPVDHDWVDATCTTPRTCSICKKIDGDRLSNATGHRWITGDCFTKTTCSVCGITEGDFIHTYSDWMYNEDDQMERRVCTICGHLEVRDYFVQYTKLEDGTYSASATKDAEGIIHIKTTYNKANVTEIAPGGFKGTNITGIILPVLMRQIGANAFEGCKKLKKIQFSTGVKKIDKYAFKGCTSLEYVFYTGTPADWAKIDFSDSKTSNGTTISTNSNITNATRLYYSATAKSGTYWYSAPNRYGDGFPAMPWGDLDNFEIVEGPDFQYQWLIRLKEGVKLSGAVILPPVLDNKRILGLANDALYRDQVKQNNYINIKIPESYQYIYDRAFAYCSKAGTLHIPKSIIYVGKGAFAFTSPTSVYLEHRWPGDGGKQWHPKWDEYSPAGK